MLVRSRAATSYWRRGSDHRWYTHSVSLHSVSLYRDVVLVESALATSACEQQCGLETGTD